MIAGIRELGFSVWSTEQSCSLGLGENGYLMARVTLRPSSYLEEIMDFTRAS
ncbi:hypothetical protein CERZMDRAFT_90578, partial [Cercospora zeae-maydis SCOH1-5]